MGPRRKVLRRCRGDCAIRRAEVVYLYWFSQANSNCTFRHVLSMVRNPLLTGGGVYGCQGFGLSLSWWGDLATPNEAGKMRDLS